MISERIKLLRTSLKKTQKEFSDDLEINQSNISSIEGGRSMPSIEIAEKITSVFPNVNPSWLLTGEGEMFRDGKTPYLTNFPKVEKKEVKTVVGNEIVDVGFLQKMLDFANKEKADLFVMVQNLLSENQRLTADIRK